MSSRLERLQPELIIYILEFNDYYATCRLLAVSKYFYRILGMAATSTTKNQQLQYLWQRHYYNSFKAHLHEDNLEYRLTQLVTPSADILKNAFLYFKQKARDVKNQQDTATQEKPKFLEIKLPVYRSPVNNGNNKHIVKIRFENADCDQLQQQLLQCNKKEQFYKFGLHRGLTSTYAAVKPENFDDLETLFEEYGNTTSPNSYNFIANGGFIPHSIDVNPDQEPLFVKSIPVPHIVNEQFVVHGDFNEPCLVQRIVATRSGKTGVPKHHLTATGIFSLRRYEITKRNNEEWYIPIVSIRKYELVNIEQGNYATLMWNEELNKDLMVTANDQYKNCLIERLLAKEQQSSKGNSSKASKNNAPPKKPNSGTLTKAQEAKLRQHQLEENAKYEEIDAKCAQIAIDWYHEQAMAKDDTSRCDLKIPASPKGVELVLAFKKLSSDNKATVPTPGFITVTVLRSMGCEMIVDWQLVQPQQ